eukprot:2625298-Alexandrium_andersonii.AAC.1
MLQVREVFPIVEPDPVSGACQRTPSSPSKRMFVANPASIERERSSAVRATGGKPVRTIDANKFMH